jgi:16S rRNA (guanine527-N7)-methyltransferase
MTPGAALADGIRNLGLAIDANAQASLLAYLALLTKWNRTYNLTAIREQDRMVTHHLLDALAVLPYFPHNAGLRIADIGSGAGLPGVPIAIARPGWSVTLVESSHKRVAFLRQANAELGLANVDVAACRVERYQPTDLFDVAVSRAYGKLRDFVLGTRHLMKQEARWLAMKGTYPAHELAQIPEGTRLVATPRLDVPGLGAEQRHLVIMERSE